MRSKYFPLLLFFLFHFLVVHGLCAQDFSLSGRIVERGTMAPLSFAHINVNKGEAELLANVDGEFNIQHTAPINTLEIKHYQYRPHIYEVKESEDSVIVELGIYTLFQFEETSDVYADRVIYNTLLRKDNNNSENNIPHSFNTYNKLIVTSNRLEDAKKLIAKNLKILGFKLKPFKKDHHLFMIESVTEKRYLNDLNQRENIIASNISGIDEASIYTMSSTLLPGSIYNNYINIATSLYLSPLNEKALGNYYFKILDTINVGEKPTYVIKFSPAKRNTDALKGLLYINSADYAVTSFIMGPAYDSPPLRIAQSYMNKQGKWFPEITRTDYLLKDYGKDNIRLNVTAKIYRRDLKWRKDLKVWDFNDVILKNKKAANIESERFWDSVRVEAFTEKDANTFAFFDTIGSVKKFEKYTTLGEAIYNGVIPIRYYNLEVDRILSANEYEGFRIGLGGHTNNLLSDKYSFGGYLGYGTKDASWKYGIKVKYVVDKKTDFTLSSSYYKDLRESAGLNFSLDRTQFPTESLRYYRLTFLDQVFVQNFEVSIKPVRYIYLTTALNLEDITPNYEYFYKNDLNTQYFFAEYKLGLKVAFGEQFLQSPQNKFLLNAKYPIFWVEYRKGLNDFFGNYTYNKWDIKMQYSYKKPGFGKQTIQINSGFANGELPYFKLYNMQGSWRTFSVVVHNSFETMRYNEFLSDRYLSVHYAHDLGKIHIRKPLFQPGIEVLHSFGIGSLRKKEDHQLLQFRTMEKGYLESGIFIYDLITINTLGLRTGLGTGIFVRYGPYSRDRFVENFLYKLGLSFNL